MLDTMDLSWKVAMRNWAIYRKFLFSNIIPLELMADFY